MDVARKLTILARELGQKIELGDFPVENLIPEPLRDVGIDEFLESLADYDDDMAARYAKAKSAGMNLRYIATLDAVGSASVELKQVSEDNAFSHIDLTDNLVQFASNRYSSNPLVVQGPGAGPAVTAGGVFGDLLKLAHYLDDGSIA
jgi:aspartokinase/homoserine dehydrogenase 1